MSHVQTERDVAMRIDVDAVLRQRLPRHYRYIPKALIAWVKRLVCQDKLNWLLEHNRDRRGADFCAGVLNDLNVTYDICDAELLPAGDDSRVTYVCNHPLGALDGIAIIDMVARRHSGRPVKFVVNDLLTVLKPLSDIFVPVNKLGAQSRSEAGQISDVFAGDGPVIVFPAGLVSRRGRRGRIHDLEWHKMFVNKSIESGRDIIPLYFGGRNSNFFYNFAKLRTRLGLRFNFEMVLLPGEVFRCVGRRFEIRVGKRISYADLRGGREAQRQAREICRKVYLLGARTLDIQS